MSCTIKEISNICGVSATTVSQILNRGNGHLYKPGTCEQVLLTAKKLGYRPNTSARAMRTGRFGSVALLSSVQEQRLHLFPEILTGIQAKVSQAGIHLILETAAVHGEADGNAGPKSLRELLVDGLIVNFPMDSMPKIPGSAGQMHGVPAIWIQTRQEYNAVYHDFFASATEAVRLLHGYSHQRIVYADYSASSHHTAVDFKAGYVQAMQGLGLAPTLLCQDERVVRKDRPGLIRSWLKKPDQPTAVITASHTTLLPILMVAAAMGIRIPQDLSVLAVGNALLDDAGIAVTTMIVPNRQMGEAAVDMLLRKIEAPNHDLLSRALSLRLEPGDTCAEAVLNRKSKGKRQKAKLEPLAQV